MPINMIVGTGVDIVEIERIARTFAKFGLKFAQKVLHPNELSRLPAQAEAYLASRFAVKEAAVKALGTGFAFGIGPRQIEVAGSGKPLLVLHDRALERARSLGASRFHVSLSHERQCAMALVILEE